MNGSTRTLIPNGPLIGAYRKRQGWTREEFEWRSHLAVERAASENTCDGRFRRRYKAKTQNGRFAGIGTTTLTNIEASKPVYAFTLKIVAKTLGVPVENLIHPDDPSGLTTPPVDDPGSYLDAIMHGVIDNASDPVYMSLQEKAQVLRKLLDTLFPPEV